MRLSSFIITICTLLSFQALGQNRDSAFVLPVADNEIKIMQYNVENLFNAVPNQGKLDWPFLPKGHPLKSKCHELGEDFRVDECKNIDWTDEKILARFKNLKRVIEAQGPLPDVLVLEEIEGEDLVREVSRGLGFSGYFFFDGPDERGIDVAILFHTRKLEPITWKAVNVNLAGQRPTRNVLRADFGIKGSGKKNVLTVFANHWPSQSNPPQYRVFVAEKVLEQIADAIKTYGAGLHVVALGDFNTTDQERPNAVKDVLAGPRTKNGLTDLHPIFDKSPSPIKQFMPPGSYYFSREKRYNRLDKVLLSGNLLDREGMEVDVSSFRIHSPSFMMKADPKSNQPLIPIKFNPYAQNPNEIGFSDHLPIVFKVKIQK